MSLEKEFQKEVVRTLNQFGGFCHKLVQDATVCPKCFSKVHPVHAGWPDYSAELPLRYGIDMAIKVEMKAGKDRFTFKELRDDQIAFLTEYKSPAYLWLQLGTERVATSSFMARKSWMIPIRHYLDAADYIQQECGVGYIPINEQAVTAFNMRFKQPALNATTLFRIYELEWLGDNVWIPNRNHTIWSYPLKVTYEQFINRT